MQINCISGFRAWQRQCNGKKLFNFSNLLQSSTGLFHGPVDDLTHLSKLPLECFFLICQSEFNENFTLKFRFISKKSEGFHLSCRINFGLYASIRVQSSNQLLFQMITSSLRNYDNRWIYTSTQFCSQFKILII